METKFKTLQCENSLDFDNLVTLLSNSTYWSNVSVCSREKLTVEVLEDSLLCLLTLLLSSTFKTRILDVKSC